MSKKREFIFKNDKGEEQKVESLSLKRAIKSAQTHFKDKFIFGEWISKKGQEMTGIFKIPMGRKKKLGR